VALNAELAAMHAISREVDKAIKDLEPKIQERVLSWGFQYVAEQLDKKRDEIDAADKEADRDEATPEATRPHAVKS
jgi:hypothetical protein